jgi:hypothetical protein
MLANPALQKKIGHLRTGRRHEQDVGDKGVHKEHDQWRRWEE